MTLDAERDRLMGLAEACADAAEGYEYLAEKVMPGHRKYLRKPESIAKHDQEAEHAAEQARILRSAVSTIEAMQAEIQRLQDDADIALASHREDVIDECAKVCEEYADSLGGAFDATLCAIRIREMKRQ